jgi:hypothetical protein
VQQFSEDEETKGRSKGVIGRVGLHSRFPTLPVDEQVVQAAAKLAPGQISPPVRSDFGWHILKCLDNQETTFEEAAERVQVELLSRRRQAIHRRLVETAKVQDHF